MKESWENIPGIGHKVKSKFNPDTRCKILDTLAEGFPQSKYLDFAKSVESLTLEKKSSLILNVDGYIAAILLDIFEDIWMTSQEKKIYVEAWIFNGLFLLARTIGFIWHAIDQKRLGEWLHRASWDSILYTE
jgi:ATP citrate (pro-S)-lyase